MWQSLIILVKDIVGGKQNQDYSGVRKEMALRRWEKMI
jgi:hypothetical protein